MYISITDPSEAAATEPAATSSPLRSAPSATKRDLENEEEEEEEEEELPRATTRASQMVSRWKAMMIQYAKALPGPFMQRRVRKKCPRRGGYTRMAQSGDVAKAL